MKRLNIKIKSITSGGHGEDCVDCGVGDNRGHDNYNHDDWLVYNMMIVVFCNRRCIDDVVMTSSCSLHSWLICVLKPLYSYHNITIIMSPSYLFWSWWRW